MSMDPLTVNDSLTVSSGYSFVYGDFTVNGSLTIGAGASFIVASGGTIDGLVTIGTGGELTANGILVLAGGTSIEGDGLLRVNYGNLQVDAAASVENLSLEDYGVISGAGTLSIINAMKWSAGTMTGAGMTLIETDAVLTIPDSFGWVTLEGGRTLRNKGIVDWQGETSIGTVNGTARYENAVDAVFAMAGNGTLWADPLAGVEFKNEGFLKKTGVDGMMQDATVFSGVYLDSSKEIDVKAGIVRLQGGGGLGGSASMAAASELWLATGTFTAVADADFTGLGTLVVGSLAPNPALPPVLSTGAGRIHTVNHFRLMANGYIEGQGELLITDELLWTGGVMRGSGRTELAAGCETTLSGTEAKIIDGRFLQIIGQTDASGSPLQLHNGARIENLGVFTIHDSFGLERGVGLGSFVNQGTFRKNESLFASESVIGVEFVNECVVVVDTGIVSFRGLLRHDGTGALTEISGDGQVTVTNFVMAGGEIRGPGGATHAPGHLRLIPFAGVNGIMDWVEGRLVDATVIVEASAGINVLGSWEVSSAFVQNFGHVQWDYGVIELGDGALFTNENTFAANPQIEILQLQAAGVGASFVNRGTFEKLGNLEVEVHVEFNNEAIVQVTQDLLTLRASSTHAGAFSVGVNGTLAFFGVDTIHTLNNGTSFSGAGAVRVWSFTWLSIPDGVVVVSTGNFFLEEHPLGGVNGGFMRGNGEFRNEGNAVLTAGGLRNFHEFHNVGTLTLNPAAVSELEINSSRIRNDGILTWSRGDFSLSNAENQARKGEIWNFHILNIQSNGIVASEVQAVGAEIRNEATGVVTNGAVADCTIQVLFQNLGLVNLNGGTARFEGGFLQESGELDLAAGEAFGDLNLLGGEMRGGGTITGSVTMSGNTIVHVNADLRLNGSLTQTGGDVWVVAVLDVSDEVAVQGGDFNIVGGTLRASAVTLTGGTLWGYGSIEAATVQNSATISVGSPLQAGTLVIAGNYTQTATGSLHLRVTSPAAGNYDVLNVQGNASFGGTLNVYAWGAFAPVAGQQYNGVVRYVTRDGAFGQIDLPPLDGLMWTVDQGMTAINLSH